MPRIARLWSDLELESSQFTVGLRKAVAEAATATTKIQKSLSGLRTGLMTTAASVASLGLAAAAREALDYASSIQEVAEQLGVSAKELQEYRYAALNAGVSQETMEKSLAKLTVTMGKARAGSKEQAGAFRELNTILGKDILASAKGAGDAIPLISDALAKLPDASKRARLEVALFGRAGQQLDPLLSRGSAAINELRDAAQKLGYVLGDDQIQRADETADKLASVQAVLNARIAGIVADNSTSILGLADALVVLANSAGQAGNAYSGFLRIASNEGWRGAMRSLFGDGRDQQQASTPLGYAKLKVNDFKTKRDAYNNARANPNSNPVEIRRLRQEMADARKLADKASGDYLSTRPTAAQPFSGGAIEGTPPPASRGGGGRRSGSDKAERTRLWYEDQIARAKIDELAVQDQIIGSYRTRYALEMERIVQERAAFARDLEQQEGLSAAQRAELTAANERVLDKRIQLADADRTAGLARENYELAAQSNELAQDMVRTDMDRARTAADRRDAELRLLVLQKQAEAAQIELILATESTASAAWQNARQRRDSLDARYASRAETVRRDTLGPLAKYLDEIPRSAREVEEAYEGIAVRGLSVMNDEMGAAIKNVLGLKGAFGDLIAELLVLEAKRSLFSLIGSILRPSGGGGSGLLGGILGGITGGSGDVANSLWGLTRMASGGSMMVGGNPGTDRNVLSINGQPRALVSAHERIDVTPPNAANDRGGMGINMGGIHLYAPGADAAALARLEARLDRAQRELPSLVLETVVDARQRRIIG